MKIYMAKVWQESQSYVGGGKEHILDIFDSKEKAQKCIESCLEEKIYPYSEKDYSIQEWRVK